MKELGEYIDYEYNDLSWLEKTMYCKVIEHRGGVHSKVRLMDEVVFYDSFNP